MTVELLQHLVVHLDELVNWLEHEDPGSLDAAMVVAVAGIVSTKAIELRMAGNR